LNASEQPREAIITSPYKCAAFCSIYSNNNNNYDKDRAAAAAAAFSLYAVNFVIFFGNLFPSLLLRSFFGSASLPSHEANLPAAAA
jgi:hypothetical protein